jgi:hypothetical protein
MLFVCPERQRRADAMLHAQLCVAAEMMREEIRLVHVDQAGDALEDDAAPWKTP